ncbi:MAG: RNA polymerase sigma factor [Gemmatimonadales bacterium]
MTEPGAGRDRQSSAWRAAECAARESYGKLLALLAVRSNDVAAAEDALADAFAAALARWPITGVPSTPDAWLLTAARRRLVDAARHQQAEDRAHAAVAADLGPAITEITEDGGVPDLRLSLMFACTHPAIDPAVRTPLILQAVLGFDARRIAAAFIQSPDAVAQRLVRAKRKIRDAAIPMHVPDVSVMPERIGAVLDAIYVAFADGWGNPQDATMERQGLTAEAIRLARLVVGLAEREPEPLGLLALLLYVESRRLAHRPAGGGYVPLSDQDPAAWDGALIDEAEEMLRRAGSAGRVGRFQLEAAIQSVHAARRRTGTTDWPALVVLYDELLRITGSDVVATNRAVARAAVDGPAAGLADLDAARAGGRVESYQSFWAARAELLARLGDRAAAHDAYQRAIGLASDPDVRRFLMARDNLALAG